jgi:hypothetical protein
VFVHVIRSPAEVAASLQKRDNKSRKLSALLWLKYNFAAIRELNFTDHHFYSYSSLVSEPYQTARSLFLRLEKFQLDADAFSNFVSGKLRHHQSTSCDLNDDALEAYLLQIFDYLNKVAQTADNRSYESLKREASHLEVFGKFFSCTRSDDLYRYKFINDQIVLENLYKQIERKDAAISDIEKLVFGKQQELSDANRRINTAESLLQARDQELTRIRNQLIETDNALSEAQRIAYSKEERINSLTEEIDRLKKRSKEITEQLRLFNKSIYTKAKFLLGILKIDITER